MCTTDHAAASGLPTLDERQLSILRRLDETLLRRARLCGFREQGFAPLSPIADLERIDYFRNFPHLGLAVAPIARAALPEVPLATLPGGRALGAGAMDDARYFLPSAACYPVYAQFREQALASTQRITTVQRCFRNEDHYEGLVRLWSFTMRELIAIGPRDDVREFLLAQKRWIAQFAQELDIPLEVRAATDPFFESDGKRARMQQLFPVKEEFVFEETVAVSSVNSHRNFFGERWNIRVPDGSHAFSGCVAFGLERWLHALSTRYADDTDAILRALESAAVRDTLAEPEAVPVST